MFHGIIPFVEGGHSPPPSFPFIPFYHIIFPGLRKEKKESCPTNIHFIEK
jgi:hypothetical protein